MELSAVVGLMIWSDYLLLLQILAAIVQVLLFLDGMQGKDKPIANPLMTSAANNSQRYYQVCFLESPSLTRCNHHSSGGGDVEVFLSAIRP